MPQLGFMSSRAACLSALLGASGALKHITLVRHGQTHANVWMRQPGNAWGAPGFRDPGLVDTRLTPEGEAQAAALNAELLADGARFDAVLCSPLSRALRTAQIALADVPIGAARRVRVTPLCSERVYLSSEVGRAPALLAAEFGATPPAGGPEFDGFDELDPRWWYGGFVAEVEAAIGGDWRPPGKYRNPAEPWGVFKRRMERLLAALEQADGERIAVVCHFGVASALLGEFLENCETRTVGLDALLAREIVEL